MCRRWLTLMTWLPLAVGHALEVSPTVQPVILVAREASVADQTAAQEVADYLGRVTGAKLRVVNDAAAAAGGRILIGGPALAKLGLDSAKLGPEEWFVRTAGNDLCLAGGQPRGTLYAAYHFLEDEVGVHWWTPWDETVPSQPRLTIGQVDRHGTPGFRYRDIYQVFGYDGGRFAARNRLNRDGDAPIDSKYGGTLAYGPPYHVHTAYLYFPPKEYFAQHPEWYSLLNGQRKAEGGQLCWTNPELRQAFLAKLRHNIETSWAAAKAAKLPPPLVFSISQNDWLSPCQCAACQAIAKAEGSECGPLLDFCNYMADAVKDQYPEIYIDTLAYQYTQQAPKTIKPRDNVIIRLCDTEADMLKPITAPANKAFHDHLLSWAAIAKNLRIWDYAVTYGSPQGMPLPTAQTFGPDFRFYQAHNVEGVFTELEYELIGDLRDFKLWTMIKTLEQPDADYERLTDTFVNGCYGAAGPLVKQYLRALEAESAQRQSSSTCWQGSPTRLTYLNLPFVTRAQQLFDAAELAVKGDATLLRRVRFARLALDRATIAAHNKLATEWLGQGGDPDKYPFDREAVAQRALDTWNAAIDARAPQARREKLHQEAEGEIKRFSLVPGKIGLPAKFKDYPRGTVFDYTAIMTRNWANVVKVVKDPAAESGVTNRLELTAEDVEHSERYNLPMPWGIYDTVGKKTTVGQPIQAADIPGPGYHWYRMGTFPVVPATYLYFFWSWIIQVDIDNVCQPAKPDQKFEMWASIKFQGPRFPHATAGDKDAISVERVVIVTAK